MTRQDWWAAIEGGDKLAKSLSDISARIKKLIEQFDADFGISDILIKPDGSEIFVNNGDWADYDIRGFLAELKKLPGVKTVDAEAEYVPSHCDDWVKAAMQSPEAVYYTDVKKAYSQDYLRRITNLMQLTKGPGNLPSGPGQLQSLLAGTALLGAGGYLGGKALSYVLPEGYGDSLPTTGLVLGGALGAAAPIGIGISNLKRGRPFLDNTLYNNFKAASSFGRDLPDVPPAFHAPTALRLLENDPYLKRQMSAQTAGSLAGAIAVAQQQASSPFLTTADMGRVAIGLGSGYAQGTLVGNILNTVFGIPQEAQTILRQTGAAAGALNAATPLLFGNY